MSMEMIKKITLSGPVMRFNQPTANGFIYTKEAGESFMKQTKEMLENKCLYGEFAPEPLDRPINIAKAAVRCTSLKMNEEGIDGEFEILDTPEGRHLNQLVFVMSERGLRVAPRGKGFIDYDTKVVDPESFQFISFDIVHSGDGRKE